MSTIFMGLPESEIEMGGWSREVNDLISASAGKESASLREKDGAIVSVLAGLLEKVDKSQLHTRLCPR